MAPSFQRCPALAGLLALLLLPLYGCTLLLQFDPGALLENTAGRCADAVDNDDNGLTDCAEPDCAVFVFCQESSLEACRDRVDNNRNGLLDCDDPSCVAHAHCDELTNGGCVDGLDNNHNGLVDCQDFSCAAAPSCCQHRVALWSAALEAGACQPGVCQVGQAGSACQAFDAADWASFGDPAPRVASGGAGLDPNRCEACYLTGDCRACDDALLLSERSWPLAPGLLVGAMLHLTDNRSWDRAGLSLTWQSSFAEPADCSGSAPALDRVAAVALVADASGQPLLRFVVDGQVERELPWPSLPLAAFIQVDEEGFAAFYVAATLDASPGPGSVPSHRSARPLPAPGAAIRVAIHGGGEGLRVSRLAVWDVGRCENPVPERVDVLTGGVALAPLPAVDGWDRGQLADPSVVFFQNRYHLYFTGRDDPAAVGAIGHAVLDEGVTPPGWRRDPAEGPVLKGTAGGWPAAGADLFGAEAVELPDGRLALYLSLAERLEDGSIGWQGIVAAVSADGLSFTQLLTPSGEPVTINPLPNSWENAVSDPTVSWHLVGGQPRFTMLYSGRSDAEDPFTAQIGLATSSDGLTWRRGNPIPADCDLPACNEPVLAPPPDALLHTALFDPSLQWDADLELFRLWYVWRVGPDFAVHHAVATAGALGWVAFPGNPVLEPGDDSWCDDNFLDGPTALRLPNGRLRFWYHGSSVNNGHAICYAENSLN